MNADEKRILQVIAIIIVITTTLVVVMAYIPNSPVSKNIDYRRRSELQSACSAGDVKTVEEMLQRYPHLVNTSLGKQGWYPITLAVSRDHIDVVDILLRYGADINAKDPSGDPMIFHAVESGNPVLLHELLQRHAKIEERTWSGESLLHIAVKYQNQECIKELTAAGLDINTVNSQGQTPLNYAVAYHRDVEIIKMLLNYSARTDIVDEYGNTPMAINERWPDEKTPLIRSILSGEEL